MILFILTSQFGFDRVQLADTKIEKVNLKLEENEIGITFIDLTSGEATLFQHGNGENVLINSGGPNTNEQLENVLKMFNVTTIDMLIITKADEQYMSNTNFLKNKFQVKKFVTGKNILMKSNLRNEVDVEKWETWGLNEKVELLPHLFVHILHDNHVEHRHLGLDLKITFYKHNLLYMSSSDRKLEQYFLDKPLSDVNILKVPHFGDKSGTSKSFVDYVDPQVAIIFRQKDEWPSQDVIERLYQTWIDIYPLKQFGNISIKLDESLYEVIPLSFEYR